MSNLYAESNKESAKELFNKRTIYAVDSENSNYPNLVDFNFAEKQLYGRVTRLFVPMVPSGQTVPLVRFPSIPDTEQLALNFVVDAFNDLVMQFKKAASQNMIDMEAPVLIDPKVYSSYQDPNALYRDYFSAISEAFVGTISAKNQNPLSFPELVAKVVPYIQKICRSKPYTMTAFVKSRFCPINTSGLVVEIDEMDFSNDLEKIEKFYKNRNWEFFLNACQACGFMVDKAAPWRLVADIGSQTMVNYATKYGLTSTDAILNIAYRKVHTFYYQMFKRDMLNLYNRARRQTTHKPQICANGEVIMKVEKSIEYERKNFSTQFGDDYFLPLYIKIRFFEEESKFTQEQKDRLIDDCVELGAIRGISTALDVFERILNKTFDYHSSLSYIKRRFVEEEATQEAIFTAGY